MEIELGSSSEAEGEEQGESYVSVFVSATSLKEEEIVYERWVRSRSRSIWAQSVLQ